LAQLLLPLENAQREKRTPGGRGGEAGYALTELLVVATLLVVVLGAILALGETTQKMTPRDTERAHAIREAQVGLHAMTKQMRQAYDLSTPTHSAPTEYTLDVTLRDGRRFSFECDQPHPTVTAYNRCVRFPVVGGVKGTGTVLIDRVLNGPAAGVSNPTPVFTYETNAAGTTTYVHVSIEVPAKGDLRSGHEHEIVLYDGVYMRNLDV
jgi:hypothetical protein